jgi:PDZ domain-containing secreted protein
MDNAKRSNYTVWIVIGLVIALLCGCTMGALVGGLMGLGISRWSAGSSRNSAVTIQVTPSSRGPADRVPSVGNDSVLITQVVKGSPAEKAGLLAGDIVVALEGQDLTRDATLANRLLRYAPGDTVRLTISRAGQQQEVRVVLGQNPDQNTRAWLGIYYQQAPAMPQIPGAD